MRLGLGLPIGVRRAPGGGAPALTPLAPTEASQTLTGAFTLRKVNPTYAGVACRIRAGGLNRDIPYDANGYADVTVMASYGAAPWNLQYLPDQMGGGVTFTTFPKIDAPTYLNAAAQAVPVIRWNTNSDKGTWDHLLSLGGTHNLSVVAVMAVKGYSGSTRTSPGSYVSGNGNADSLLSYGSSKILSSSAGPASQTALYNKTDVLYVDMDTPSGARLRAAWFNQGGAVVSGGDFSGSLFTGRPHGVAEALGQTITLGSSGIDGNAPVGDLLGLYVYQNAAALTDTECARIALYEREFWGAQVTACRFPNLYYGFAIGQSNAEFYFGIESASTGVATDAAAWRVLEPEFASLMGARTDQTDLIGKSSVGGTAFAATSAIKQPVHAQTPNGPDNTWLPYDGEGGTHTFWWDQEFSTPGPILAKCLLNIDANFPPGAEYRNVWAFWAQGESNIGDMLDDARRAQYEAAVPTIWAAIRSRLEGNFGLTNVPIFVQPIGSVGVADSDTKARLLRLVQNDLVAAATNVTMLPDVTHLDMNDDYHLAKGPANANGYDRGAKQIARGAAAYYGADVAWQGPTCASYTQIDGNTLDINIVWPAGGGGTDIATRDGSTTGMLGFAVYDTDGTVARTLTAARQSASSIRLTITGAALSGTLKVDYNPTPYLLDRNKMVVDNNAGLPLPLTAAEDIPSA